MSKGYYDLDLIERIKFWKDKYRHMPNGWWMCSLIGEQYINADARISAQARKKRKSSGLH
jgi:hypothetical protein